jgi:hypothetical protein
VTITQPTTFVLGILERFGAKESPKESPLREYKPKEPTSVGCSEQICMVSGLLDFRAADPVAKIVSEGVASFEYHLRMSEGTVKITLEAGEVLKRIRTPLSNVVMPPGNLSAH